MTSHKTNINTFRSKLYNNYQSIIIAFDIKDVMLITNIINAVECSLYFCKIVPRSSRSFHVPIL